MFYIYRNFQEAFDRVDYPVLLEQLFNFGLSVNFIKIFKSYLLDRPQFVEYEGFKSEFYIATSMVPQGFNLTPLLFILFINNVLESLACSKNWQMPMT